MVLRKYLGELTRCLSSQDQLLSVAMNLYAKGLISEEVKDMVISGKDGNYAKAASLLSAVEKQVKTSNALAGFLEVLKANEIGQPLVEQIIRDENFYVNSDGHIMVKNSLVRQGSSQDSGYDPMEHPPHHNQLDMLLSALHEQPPGEPFRHRSSSYPSAQPTSNELPNNYTNSQQQQQQLLTAHDHPLIIEHYPHRAPVTTASQPQNTSSSHIAVVSPHGAMPSSAIFTQLTPTGSPQSYHFQQSAATPSILSAAGTSKLQLMCEVQNANTGAVITSTTQTTVYRDITVRKKNCSVPQRTPLCMRVQANQRCYIYIINIGSSGNINTLVPNQYEPRHFLEPEAMLEFPSREADYEFELDGQSGEEIIVLLAYSTPCETQQAERDCSKLRARENTVYRDITIKRKLQVVETPTCDKELNCNAPLGYLEVHFTHK